MKKLSRLGLMFFTIGNVLFGCTSKTDRFAIERQENIQKFIEIDKTKLADMINKKNNFVLVTIDSCTCSGEFANNLLIPLIKEKSIVVYKISKNNYSHYNFGFTINSPELLFYKSGKLINHVEAANKWEGRVNNYSNFKKYVEKYIYLDSPIFNITKEEVDAMKNEKKTFFLYYKWYKCSDCTLFTSLFLDKWAQDPINKDKKIYAIDVDKYGRDSYDPENEASSAEWLNFTKEMGLSKEGNTTYGYLTGKVPTLQYYKNGTLSGTAVIYNAVLSKDGHLESSYYGEFSDQVFEDYTSYREQTTDFYGQKFEELLANEY